MEAWVTSAVEEKDVTKTIVLAGSLRRVYTAKKLVVLVSPSISKEARERLNSTFDLVFILQPAIPNGLSLEESAKVEAFSILVFSKCVYLSPNTLVLKNCDEIFDKYSKFAGAVDGNDDGVDSSVYLFTPSVEQGRALNEIAHRGDDADKTIGFAKSFNLWIRNNVPNWEKLDGEYNSHLQLQPGSNTTLGSNGKIANFGSVHPLELAPDGSCERFQVEVAGRMEKFAVDYWRSIYLEDIGGAKSNLADSVKPEVFKTEPIAIVGLSFRLPASNNVEEFWDLLDNGREAIRLLPESRWSREHTHIPCQNRNIEAGFLSVPVDEFDANFFGISGKEAEYLDPQQRFLHEVTWEALEDAMIDPHSLRGTKTGVFVGSWLQDYKDMVSRTTDPDFFRVYMGSSIASGAARLSHFLETTGPSIGTESGCSSAIVAVDMACKSLRNRDSNLALACGVNLLLHPFDSTTLSFVIAPDGRCKTFDEGANGFGRAEGCAVLIMKRLSDAVRDGDQVWGMIRGSAITQEGVSKSLGTPTVYGESLAMDLALQDAEVDPADVSYVEAHGTGTPVGDPVEIAAITKTYSKGRSEPLVIGSVKTNIGHTESVSGITGIIKVLLSMKHEKIPKHLNLDRLNPAINLNLIPAKIPTEPIQWPIQPGKPRIAGVSSFGISGTDGHVIIQEPPQPQTSHNRSHDVGNEVRPLHIMKISAKSPASFQELIAEYQNIFTLKENGGEGFADIAYSANTGRATFNHRAVILAKDFREAAKVLQNQSFKRTEIKSSGDELCFLFTGQGSQYPKMGAELYATSPVFRDAFDKCDAVLMKRYGINLREVLWGPSSSEVELSRSLYSQTSIFCIEYCLLQLWMSWGVKPDYVMGHSLGEFAAAVAAGALDFEDALMLVAERSRLIDNLPKGKMLVIKADKETVEKYIKCFKQVNSNFWLDYAAINSPDQTVVAGDSAMIEEFAKYCKEKSLKTIVLAASHAFHSRHMDPMLEAYRKVAQTVKSHHQIKKDAPKYISGVEGKLLELESIDADYWVRHTREPVNFIDACKTIQNEGCSLFLEIGPHPILSALTLMNADGHSLTCLPSIRKKEDEWVTLLDSLGNLYLSDWKGEVNWNGFDGHYNRTRVSLPFYAFNRKPIWKHMEGTALKVHPLLGKHIPTSSDSTIFENRLTLKNAPFTPDHVIGNTVVFPGAGFLELCLAGGHATMQGSSGELMKPRRPVTLQSLKIASPLALYDTGVCRLQTMTKLDMDDRDGIRYRVVVSRYVPSRSGDMADWITHATAEFLPSSANPTTEHSTQQEINISEIQTTWEEFDSAEFYSRLPEVGLRFGPQFQSLGRGWKSEQGLLLPVQSPTNMEADAYLIHPVVADAMIQATRLSTEQDKRRKMWLQVPVQIGQFTWIQPPNSPTLYAFCWKHDDGKVDCTLLDGEGNRLAYMTGVDFIETSVKVVEGMISQQESAMPKLWKEEWRSAPGALQSPYNFTRGENVLECSDQQKQAIAEITSIGVEETAFHENLAKLIRLHFLNAMYELGWMPPSGGTQFTLEELVKLLPDPEKHFKKYIRFFLQSLVETGMLVSDSDPENAYHFEGSPPTKSEIVQRLEGLINPAQHSRVEYRVATEVGRNLSKVLKGELPGLQVLFPDNVSKSNAAQLYTALQNFIQPLMNPVMEAFIVPTLNDAFDVNGDGVLRILEIGAGTGVFTATFLDYQESWGKPFEYHFTDISAAFFNAAEKRFQKYSNNMVYKKFDMEGDPLAQGFCPKYFDMIIACEVIHVAKDIRKTLLNIKSLLKPGGIFEIIETVSQDPRITQAFGLLEGYWQFEDFDLRPHHATLTPEKWGQVLREVNFDKVVSIPIYNNVHSVIIAALSPVDMCDGECPALREPNYSWLIFNHEPTANLSDQLVHKLIGVNRRAHTVRRPQICTEEDITRLMGTAFSSAEESGERLEGVVFLWPLSEKGRESREQSQVSLPLINLVQKMMEYQVPHPRLYVVTQGAAVGDGFEVTNPTAATLHGIVKSLSNEITELPVCCLDLSPDGSIDSQAEELFYEFWLAGKENRSVAFREGKRLRPKLLSAKLSHNDPLPLPSGCDRFQLILPETRMLSDLEFGALDKSALEGDEIEVQVKAMALNFRDVFAVLKPVPQFERINSVGLDFAGVVSKVGSNVAGRKVGDRVIGINMNDNPSLPSHIKIKHEFVVVLPESFTFSEGVTLPAVFATASLCLINVGKMKRGDTVLIHTATGGVGLCAIQLAKQAGAEIIATAGSKRKRNYLRNLGIQHVFHSRTTHFGKGILEVTNGKGVDIVLNSLTGQGFKEASLSALAKNGRFIEMSKLNVWSREEVEELRPDVSYNLVDLTTLEQCEMQKLMEQLKEYISNGSINPIPYERFDAVNIRGALNYLQKAKHIGKIVCAMPEFQIKNHKVQGSAPLFNEYSTYLVTGGLGGIGFEVVRWMLASGARHIAIASRSPPKPQIASLLASWNKGGKHVEAFPMDIGNYDQLLTLFERLKSPSSGFPQIRGVMHAAGVLSDGAVENQTWTKFNYTFNPKVNGTWNLHDLTKGLLLEHFVLFSSMTAILGTPAQTNHAASNSFEDALAAYRKSIGLPATTVNWGNWGEVGVAVEVDLPGFRPLTTSQGILALETFLKTQTSSMSVFNAESFGLATKLFPGMKYFVDDKLLLGDQNLSVMINTDEFWKQMDGKEDRQGKLLIFKTCIKSTLRNILKMERDEVIDDHVDFQSLGVDSLMMLEMKNGLQNMLGSRMTITASQLKDCSDTGGLANRLVDILLGEDDLSKVTLPTMEELHRLIVEDSILPDHVQPSQSIKAATELAGIDTVLVTGVTGTLGPYLLRELSNRPTINKIFCLVRKSGKLSPTERLVKRLEAVGLEAEVDMNKVEVIQGDITTDKFGLSEKLHTRLAADTDAIFNSSVKADHVAKYYKAPQGSKQDLRTVNVKGTLRILEFAVNTKLKHVYHASAMINVLSVDDLDDDDDKADDEDQDAYDLENHQVCLSEQWQEVDAFHQISYNAGYPISKHISEQLCRQAVERGIPCKTFRHPFIAGDSRTGRCDFRTNHVLLRWLAFLKLRCMPDVPVPTMAIPVDHCAQISLDVFFNPQAPAEVFNVIHPGGGFEQILVGLAAELGIPIKPVPVQEFVEILKGEKDDSPLASFKKLYEDDEVFAQQFEERGLVLKTILECSKDNPNFFLSPKLSKLVENYAELETTEEVMRRDVRFLKESGVFQKFGIE